MNEKKIGAILAYILVFLNSISGLLFTPILLNNIGDEAYGIYKLAVSWTSIVSVLDFGLGGTITRFVVKYRSEQDDIGENNFLSMAFSVYAFLSSIVLVIGIIFSWLLPNFLDSTLNNYKESFRIIIFILVLKTSILLFNHAYTGLFTAYEYFAYIKGSSILMVVLRFLSIAFLLPITPSIFTVVIVDLILAIIQLLLNMYMKKKYKMKKIRYCGFDKKIFKQIVSFTSSLFLISVINQFNSNIDSIVLGSCASAILVGLYSSIIQIYVIYSSMSTAIQDIFLPEISRMVFNKKNDLELTDALIFPSRMQLCVLTLALSGFVLFGFDFLNFWIGANYSVDLIKESYYIGIILLASATWQLSINTVTAILKAKCLLNGKVVITSISTIVNFIITIILVPYLGMFGAAIGTAFSMIFGYGIASNIYYARVLNINLKYYYKNVLSKLWYAIIVAMFIGVIITKIPVGGVIGFILKSFIYILSYSIIVVSFGFKKEEKNKFFKNSILRLKNKNSF